jgi:hypothetical protein
MSDTNYRPTLAVVLPKARKGEHYLPPWEAQLLAREIDRLREKANEPFIASPTTREVV